MLPVTGWSAEFGQHEWHALKAAAEWTQQKHPGVNIELVLKDTQSDTKNAVAAFQSLQRPPELLLVESSSASFAIAPLLQPKKTIMLSVSTNPEVTRQSDYIFRCLPTANEEARVVLPYAIEQLKVKRLSLLYINNDYGTGFLQAFENYLGNRNAKLNFSDSFASETTDFRSLIEKLKASNADAVFVVGYGSAMGTLINSLRVQQFSGQILACSAVIYDDVLSVAKESARGVIYADIPFEPKSTSEEGSFFTKRYSELAGKAPSPLAAMVYDSVRMTLEALLSQQANPEKARSRLLEQSSYAGINKTIRIPESRDLQFGLVIKRVP